MSCSTWACWHILKWYYVLYKKGLNQFSTALISSRVHHIACVKMVALVSREKNLECEKPQFSSLRTLVWPVPTFFQLPVKSQHIFLKNHGWKLVADCNCCKLNCNLVTHICHFFVIFVKPKLPMSPKCYDTFLACSSLPYYMFIFLYCSLFTLKSCHKLSIIHLVAG